MKWLTKLLKKFEPKAAPAQYRIEKVTQNNGEVFYQILKYQFIGTYTGYDYRPISRFERLELAESTLKNLNGEIVKSREMVTTKETACLDAFQQWLNPNPEKVEVKRKIDLDRILTGLSIPLALFLTCWYWYQGNGAATLAYGLSLIYATLYYSTFTRNPNEL